ncbi:DUF547 domain-containing protein [Hwangdonia sp.]|uniref:DUF547 domain-containing protein n=1 Tax=Hwangdonia sp. TaxID=1883432 RepID=UPI003AB89929
MKYLILTTFVIILSACARTKKVVEHKPNPVVQSEIDTKKEIDSPLQKETEVADNGFHQKLTKGVITTHQLWDELLVKHVSENGNVNYKSFKIEHKKLLDYIYALSLFYANDAFNTISNDEKLAFWINAYNAFTIDLILRQYPLKSIKDIKKPWEQRLWKLGEKEFSLNDIEHEILRKMDEPRIHFTIVCASVSCPKLLNEAYTAENLEAQLTKATKGFLSDSTKNNISKDSLELSKIFQWFAKDFKQNGSLVDFLNQYSDVQISAKAKKSYKSYNWDLNE